MEIEANQIIVIRVGFPYMECTLCLYYALSHKSLPTANEIQAIAIQSALLLIRVTVILKQRWV